MQKKSLFRMCTVMALLFVSLQIFAQETTINGTVLSGTDNEPLIGVTVREKGSKNATITDLDGNFNLKVSNARVMLEFSYVGFTTKSLVAAPSMKVVLSENAQSLNELVVVGYQSQRKADLTGAVAVVSTESLKTTPDTDPMRALQGRVAGMTVTTDGSPAGTGTVRIRGIGSINSSQDPLYIVDGVPTTRALNSLNMNDIESMQVLKDAASASIYGSRAANGVIIITTRHGQKNDKVDINFSANITAQYYSSQSKMKLSNSAEYATEMAQAALNDGLDPVAYAQNYGLNLNSTGGTPITVYNPATGKYSNYTVGGYYDGYINRKKTILYSDTNWLDAISQTGIMQNYDLSISHATDKSSVMFSLGYKNNEGILKYTNFDNISARINSTFQLTKEIKIGENVTISHSNQVASSPMENALKMSPTVPLYEEDGTTFSGPVGGMSDRQNPLRELYQNRDNNLETWRIFGNAFVELTPIKGLTLKSNFGLDYATGFHNYRTFTYYSDIVSNNIPKTDTGQSNDCVWTWSNTANYNFTLAKDHNFTVLLGTEAVKAIGQSFSAYAESYALETNDYMWPDASTGVQKAYGSQGSNTLFSLFGKIDYNWKDMLLASATIRRDGSSRFGKNHRYGTFPAATLGFRLSELLKKDWINDLKLRASWGITGNQAINNTARYALYTADYGTSRESSTAYDLTLQGSGTFPSGFRLTQSANDNLKWEGTTQYNIGLDFTLFNSSLYGTVDAYVKKVEDMLISPAFLAALGEGGATWLNGPSLQDNGMEFTLGYRNKTSFGLGYDISGNLDFFRSWVTYLPDVAKGSYAHTPTEDLVQAKKPYGSRVGYVVDGLYQTEEEVFASGQPNARLGGLKYADLDGNGIINSNDQTWIFNPVPDYSWGLNISLNYKNFDLSMFWQGVMGQDVYNDQKFQTDFWSLTDAGSNKGNRMLAAWTKDNTSSTIPALTTNNTGDEGRASTYFVETGSYLKLRTLQIGYNFPTSLIKKVKMSSARFYLSGQNLLTIKSSGYTCSDPENGNWAYPHATSLSMGLHIGF